MDAKPFHIRFDKADVVIKFYDGIRYFELSKLYNEELIIEYIMQFLIVSIILYVKKVMINIVLIMISRKSELIHIILYL